MDDRYSQIQTIENISEVLKNEDFLNTYFDEISQLMNFILDPSEVEYVTYDINGATVMGLFVKISKCYNEIISSLTNNKGDVLIWLFRPLYEAFVLLKYLILKGEDSQRHYRLVSYKNRFKILDECKRRNNGLDKVMLTKFYNAIKIDGFSEIDFEKEEAKKNQKKWKLDGKSFYEIHKEVESPENYSYVYGFLSEITHSSWSEIRQFELEQNTDGRFFAKLTYNDKVDRIVFSIIDIVLDIAAKFLNWSNREKEIVLLSEHIRISNLLNDYVLNNYETNHEMYLTQ